ncbi:DUF945 family protein [Larsenimonas rhizosphaerae]|uniref:DUF945 family protein n=1 Tax=Larsenimonas rhizosphaerae TaxID=2944682 RepID=A0AA42CUL7_9GAMM|nr:DUF945 family protein [Larsenimonas rhizosphaerae]MCX2524812.1 DUF945 family protein [Larsenimonas rhizosphaerae]
MKKAVVYGLGGVIIVGAALWVGGHAYSAHRFDQELTRQVEQINAADNGMTMDVADRHDGWFTSTGVLNVRYQPDAQATPLNLQAPWTAHHGLLSTGLDGTLDARTGANAPWVLSDILADGKKAHFDATLKHFDQSGKAELEMPDMKADTGLQMMNINGLTIRADYTDASVNATADLAGLEYRDAQGAMTAGASRFVMDQKGPRDNPDHQKYHMTSDGLTLSASQLMPVTIGALEFSGEAVRDNDQWNQHSSGSLNGIEASGQALGDIAFESTLDGLDATAWQAIAAIANEHPEWFEDTDAITSQRTLTAISPHVLKLLAPSPVFTLKTLSLESPMVKEPVDMTGRLTFDGQGIDTMPADALTTPQGQDALINRLNGTFTLNHAPPLVALFAGLSPDQQTLVFRIDQGVVTVNDQRLMRLN